MWFSKGNDKDLIVKETVCGLFVSLFNKYLSSATFVETSLWFNFGQKQLLTFGFRTTSKFGVWEQGERILALHQLCSLWETIVSRQ